MKTIEEQLLIAVIDGDDAEAALLLSKLLPGERAALARAADRLAALCAKD